MKQRSPVLFVAGFFPGDRAICATHAAKDRALRHTRQAPCRSSLTLRHARFGTPEARLDRCPYAHRSDSAEASGGVSVAGACPAVPRFPAQFLQVICMFAQILWAQQMARPLLERRDRKLAPTPISLRALMTAKPGRNVRRPVGLLALAQERRGAIGDPPCNEGTQHDAQLHYSN
jgi:hypothetical protein